MSFPQAVSCTLKICKRTTVTLPGIGRPKKELKGAGGTGPKPASSAEHPMAAGPFLRWPPNLMVTSSATTPPLTKMPSARSTFLSADFNGDRAKETMLEEIYDAIYETSLPAPLMIRCMLSAEKNSGIDTVPLKVPRKRFVSAWLVRRAR